MDLQSFTLCVTLNLHDVTGNSQRSCFYPICKVNLLKVHQKGNHVIGTDVALLSLLW